MSARPVWLTMPSVTVWSSPNGLPITSTHSATTTWSESPSGTNGSGRLASTLSSATSDSASAPTTRAGTRGASAPKSTSTASAPSTTCAFVITQPSRWITKPEPIPLRGPSFSFSNSSRSCSSFAPGGGACVVTTPTTAGITASASFDRSGSPCAAWGSAGGALTSRVQRARGLRRQAPLQPTPPRRAPPSPTCPPPPANVGSRTRWGPRQRLRKEAKLGGAPAEQRGSGYAALPVRGRARRERTRSSARRSASV